MLAAAPVPPPPPLPAAPLIPPHTSLLAYLPSPTLTPPFTHQGWTLRRLRSLLSGTLEAHGIRMPGVNEPYLYVGSWRSVFAWQVPFCLLAQGWGRPGERPGRLGVLLFVSHTLARTALLPHLPGPAGTPRTWTCTRSTTCTAAPPSSGEGQCSAGGGSGGGSGGRVLAGCTCLVVWLFRFLRSSLRCLLTPLPLLSSSPLPPFPRPLSAPQVHCAARLPPPL